jgi:hypothetical protein
VKLTAHLQIVPRSRKRGFMHTLTHSPSWRSAELLKQRDTSAFSAGPVLEQRLKETAAMHTNGRERVRVRVRACEDISNSVHAMYATACISLHSTCVDT